MTDPVAFPFSHTDRLDVDPLLTALRRDQPLIRIQMPFGEAAWMVTRHEDVKTVLIDPRFSRALALDRDEPRLRLFRSGAGSVLSYDPPEHSRLRRLVTGAFTARRVEQLRPRAQQIADDLVDAMLTNGPPADLVEDFALPLPITVICELLGVPYQDRNRFRVWSEAFFSTTRLTAEQVADYVRQMREYLAGLIAERRATPRDDLLSALVAARDEGDLLTGDELLELSEGLLAAGHETTATQIPNFVYILLTHSSQLSLLRSDLDRVPMAVEELMRFVPLGAGNALARYAREDVELGGGVVRAGEAVVVNLASANRDESTFSDPQTLDLQRGGAPHVGFGHGPHHCLGAPLARMELQIALRTLIARLPGLRIAGPERDLTWKTGLATRGPEGLPVEWDADVPS